MNHTVETEPDFEAYCSAMVDDAARALAEAIDRSFLACVSGVDGSTPAS